MKKLLIGMTLLASMLSFAEETVIIKSGGDSIENLEKCARSIGYKYLAKSEFSDLKINFELIDQTDSLDKKMTYESKPLKLYEFSATDADNNHFSGEVHFNYTVMQFYPKYNPRTGEEVVPARDELRCSTGRIVTPPVANIFTASCLFDGGDGGGGEKHVRDYVSVFKLRNIRDQVISKFSDSDFDVRQCIDLF